MRVWLAGILLVATTAPALACFEPDLDHIAAGPLISDTPIGDGPYKLWVTGVPARPSFYVHRGTDENRPPPAFTLLDGTPIAAAPIYTGIPEYPLRYDLPITSGTIVAGTQELHHYEIDPAMAPHTRSVTTEHWNSYLVVEIHSDAALLEVHAAGKMWTMSMWEHQVLYFETEDVRIIALYGDRTTAQIYGAAAPSAPPPPAPDRRGLLGILGLLGVFAVVAARGHGPCPDAR